jgi:hypothetical protein
MRQENTRRPHRHSRRQLDLRTNPAIDLFVFILFRLPDIDLPPSLGQRAPPTVAVSIREDGHLLYTRALKACLVCQAGPALPVLRAPGMEARSPPSKPGRGHRTSRTSLTWHPPGRDHRSPVPVGPRESPLARRPTMLARSDRRHYLRSSPNRSITQFECARTASPPRRATVRRWMAALRAWRLVMSNLQTCLPTM